MSPWLVSLNVGVLIFFALAALAKAYYAKLHRKLIKDTDAFVEKISAERQHEVQMIELMLQTQALYFAKFAAVLGKTYAAKVTTLDDEMHLYIPLPTGLVGYVIHRDYMQYFLDFPEMAMEFELPYPIELTMETIDHFLDSVSHEKIKSFIAAITP